MSVPTSVKQKAMAYAIAAKNAAAQREAAQRGEMPPEELPHTVMEWALKYRRIDGRPFSLRRFEPNRALYEDQHRHIVIIKPAQRGLSEFALNATMFALDRGADVWTHGEDKKEGLNVGYVMPTDKALREFSKERISGMEQESAYLAGMFRKQREFNAVEFKQIGPSYLYLRGGQEANNLTTFPADFLVLDEFDRLPEQAPALARRRMNASLVNREIDLSTPTIPGYGIHAAWLLSDQQEYEQIHGCGTSTVYDFFRDVTVNDYPYDDWRYWGPDRINDGRVELICPGCGDPVDDVQRTEPGQWVSRAPSHDLTRGYWMPALAYPVVNLKAFALTAIKEEPTEIEEFYRSDLGMPYSSGGVRVTRELLQALSAELENGLLPRHEWIQTTMGIDVGARLHYRVSSKSRTNGEIYVREVGWVRTEKELCAKIDQFRPRMFVMDAMPETRLTDSVVSRYPGRGAGAIYPEGALALKGNLYAPERDKILESKRVSINRTMALDTVLAVIQKQEEHWPAAIHNDPEVIEHMTASQRVTVLDRKGEPRSAWVHTRPDHTFHACAYDQVARRILTEKGGKGSGLGVVVTGGAKDSRFGG
jgi:hypothetical protein